MKLLVAEGLMHDPVLIKCAEFDWFSVRCREDGPSFTCRPGHSCTASVVKWFHQNSSRPLTLKLCFVTLFVHFGCFVVEISYVEPVLLSWLKPFTLAWLKGDKAAPTHVWLVVDGPEEHSNSTLSPCDYKLVWLCCRWEAALSNCCCGNSEMGASNPVISVSPQQWLFWTM